MNSNNLLEKLRKATAALHERLERKNPAQFILDHSIGLEAYKDFLLQNYQAYQHLEARIAAFLPHLKADKAVRLGTDLEALEMDLPSNPPIEVSIKSVPEAFGAAYVVEGSALGGMVIAKHLLHCEQLSVLKPQHFFNGNKDCLAGWSFFKEELARQDFNQKEEEELLAKARESFLFFESIYRQKELQSSE